MLHADPLIIVRGGGDLATGTILRLWRCRFRVLVLETPEPMAVRRCAAVCEAVYEGSAEVEGMSAVRIPDAAEAGAVIDAGKIPVLVDPEGSCIPVLKPDVVIDALVAKRNVGTNRSMAPLTIGLGPGFTAGKDVDYVIETMRGHNLGRVIEHGSAMPNTGVPGLIAGHASDRVIHAPVSGVIRNIREIGDQVEKGEIVAWVTPENGTAGSLPHNAESEIPVLSPLTGLLRGMIHSGCHVIKDRKVGDVDPRISEYQNCFTVSDKARCIAGSVLEVICREMRSGRV